MNIAPSVHTPSYNRHQQKLFETAGTGTPNFDSPMFDATPIANGHFAPRESDNDETEGAFKYDDGMHHSLQPIDKH